MGWCAAVNLALQKATGEHLVILGNDVARGPGWVEGLITCRYQTPAVLQDMKKAGLGGL